MSPVKAALLPAGFEDMLPPIAKRESWVIGQLLNAFDSYGYQRVKPPLLEFEQSLVSGTGVAVSEQTFRLMDPVSQRMLGVRADMTAQIARIARTRLDGLVRPLRISYSGQVVRVQGNQIRPNRQFSQAGAELIGATGASRFPALAESIDLALTSLKKLGIEQLSLDLTLPKLTNNLLQELDLNEDVCLSLAKALDQKDTAEIERLSGQHKDLLMGLAQAAGPAELVLSKLLAMKLPQSVTTDFTSITQLVAKIRSLHSDVTVTLDPVEQRGFQYHEGVGFTFYSGAAGAELGTGGEYLVRYGEDDSDGEPASGFTFYSDSLLKVAQSYQPAQSILMATDTKTEEEAKLREEGWIAIKLLDPQTEILAHAKQMNCGFIFANGAIKDCR